MITAWTCALIFIILGFGSTDALKSIQEQSTVRNIDFNSSKVVYNYATNYTDDIFPLNHFAYTTDHKFRLKYLHNTTFYKPGGPIFFYAGNEGPIEAFADNTGIMYDLAPQFNAAIVFAEHRYYGQSVPYKDHNKTYNNLGYLTSIQALADFAVFIPWFKEKWGLNPTAKVVIFGGSYGGMLGAWFRIKYPTLSVGAWASSAPVLFFPNTEVSFATYDHTVKHDFVKSGCDSNVLEKALKTIWRLPAEDLNRIFKIEDNLIDTFEGSRTDLYTYVQYAFETLSVTNYPYPNSFVYPMPGWPVAVACQQFSGLNSSSSDIELATALAAVVGVCYNSTGQVTSTDYTAQCYRNRPINIRNDKIKQENELCRNEWFYQICTEIVMPMCSFGPQNDFFNVSCDATNAVSKLADGCVKLFQNMGYKADFMNPNAVRQIYGFDFSSATNIIFTNGEMDPWSGGRVTNSTPGIANAQSRGIYNYFITGSAHHLDLRQPNSCDPPSVVNARYQAVQVISCWLNGTSELGCPVKQQALPVFDGPYNSTANCRSLVYEYPWGQEPM